MYIGDFIKQYRETNGVSIEDFANKAGLTTSEIEVLEKNVRDDGTIVPVAMRQIKGIAAAMDVPMPMVMAQIPSDQELVGCILSSISVFAERMSTGTLSPSLR